MPPSLLHRTLVKLKSVVMLFTSKVAILRVANWSCCKSDDFTIQEPYWMQNRYKVMTVTSILRLGVGCMLLIAHIHCIHCLLISWYDPNICFPHYLIISLWISTTRICLLSLSLLRRHVYHERMNYDVHQYMGYYEHLVIFYILAKLVIFPSRF